MSGTDGPWSAAAEPVGPSRLATWHQEAFAAVERWKWLHVLNDRVSAVTQPLYDRYRGNLAVELMHGGRWAGHSASTPRSATCRSASGRGVFRLVLDTVGKDRSDDGSRMDPAATLSAAGLVAAVATAATGVTDWNVSDGEDRRVGLFHGLLNLAGTTLQAASLAARLGGHTPSARVLAATSMTVTAAAGVVGGHLVQGRAVMVNRVATTTGPTRWVQAVAETDLADGASTGVVVEGRQILLHRDGEHVHALDDLCSHAGGLLQPGRDHRLRRRVPAARFAVRPA